MFRDPYQGDTPYEWYSPTQPFPTKPAPFVLQSFTEDDVNPWLLTPEQQQDLKSRIREAGNGKGPQGGLLPLKADPLAFAAERPPKTASVVAGLGELAWSDANWMRTRSRANAREAPISIYECHIGSWMRVPEAGNRYLSYDELADRLVAYVKEMGFTHLELLPISEYPFDGSWGYQPIGLFAPTSRFGSPDEFRALVDAFHRAGIGGCRHPL